MRNCTLKLPLWVLLLSILPFHSSAALTDTTITANKDSYTNTLLSTTNFGTNTTMKSGTAYTGGKLSTQSHQRAFVEFDLSGIPANAIIYSADVKLRRNGSVSGSVTWYLKMIESSWTETGITASNQPTITTNTNYMVVQGPDASTLETFDVTDMVQNIVYGGLTNYGWCLQVENEAANANTGATFYTREYGTSSDRPKLEVSYYIPLSLASVTVNHESSTGASDGSISISIQDGASSTFTYAWEDATGNPVTGSTSVSSLDDGWYGVYVLGNQYSEKLYYGFLVGTQCEEVTITYTTQPEYTANAYTDSRNSGGTNYTDVNYGDNADLNAQNWNYSPWTDQKSFLKFHLWMDSLFTINQADLELQGDSHYNSGTSNAWGLQQLTEYWNEDLITWNIMPDSSSAIEGSYASTSSSTQDQTTDFSAYWEHWKINPDDNFGVVLQLKEYDDDANARIRYHSPNATTSTDRPEWTFKLELRDEYECADYSYYLKSEVEQSIAYVPGNTLKFKFLEDYFDTSGNLDYTLTLLETDGEQTGTLSKSHLTNWFELENGVGGVTLTSGKVYLLQVENTKGQKAYLKFKMS